MISRRVGSGRITSSAGSGRSPSADLTVPPRLGRPQRDHTGKVDHVRFRPDRPARTVRKAENLEPAFVHADQVDASRKKLAEHRAHRRQQPNFLIFLMDDVGWGDFGCYGGGVAVGAPTPNFDKLAPPAACSSPPAIRSLPVRRRAPRLLTGRVPHRHGLQRPPMYGEPGGLQGEITLPKLLSARPAT